MLEAHLSRFPPPATNYRGETVIAPSGDSAAVALGRIAQTRMVRSDVVEFLANIAAARTDLGGREEIVRGMAGQWYRMVPDMASRIRERLLTSRGDAVRRAFEVEVADSALKTVPGAEKNQLLRRLIGLWSQEADPAQRVALARIIGMAWCQSTRGAPRL